MLVSCLAYYSTLKMEDSLSCPHFPLLALFEMPPQCADDSYKPRYQPVRFPALGSSMEGFKP
jgi:hypothetical protein